MLQTVYTKSHPFVARLLSPMYDILLWYLWYLSNPKGVSAGYCQSHAILLPSSTLSRIEDPHALAFIKTEEHCRSSKFASLNDEEMAGARTLCALTLSFGKATAGEISLLYLRVGNCRPLARVRLYSAHELRKCLPGSVCVLRFFPLGAPWNNKPLYGGGGVVALST